MNNPIVWFEIYVADIARAKAFYEHMLGTTLAKLDGPDDGATMWSFPMDPEGSGAGGALVQMRGVEPGGGGTLVYFRCDDCAVEAGRAVAAGGAVHQPKFAIGQYGHIALVVDTEGNMVGLHSMT